MHVKIKNQFDYCCELRAEPALTGVPLSSDSCTADMCHLVDEAMTTAVLNGQLADDIDTLQVRIEPIYQQEPVVEGLRIELSARRNGTRSEYAQTFKSGPWVRLAQKRLLQLREEGSLDQSQAAYRMLVALPNANAVVAVNDLQPPVIEAGTLEDCGIRQYDAASLTPDRPVLVNSRFAEDAVRMCEQAGPQETGGAALGRMIRLAQPLPGTSTRVVTILSSIVPDSRHIGTESRFQLSPEALAESQQMADMRGLGEQVVTIFHTHGWNPKCGNCNQSATCPLFEATPSVHDYDELLDQLFTSKATLLPIAGRKLGAAGTRPVLQIHAYRGGEMRPIRWGTYQD